MFGWIAFAVTTVVAYGSLLVEHGQHLWQREHFRFFPVYLVAAGVLTIQHLRRAEFPDSKTWRIEPVSFGAALLLLVAALWFWSPWLGAVSILLLADSLLCCFPAARRSCRLLALLVPLPLGLDSQLVQTLQRMSSVRAGGLLDWLGVPHLMRGNVLELSGKRLFVEEACSGISSIYLLMAATLFYVVVNRPRLIHSLPLLLSVVWWAIVSNVCRIVIVAVAHHVWQWDLTSGWPHDCVGLVTMLFAFLGIFSTQALIEFLLGPTGDDHEIRFNHVESLTATALWNIVTATTRSSIQRTHRARFSVVVSQRRLLTSLMAILLAVSVSYWGMIAAVAMRASVFPEAPAVTVDEFPAQPDQFFRLNQQTFSGLPGFQITDFDRRTRSAMAQRDLFGANSRTWEFTAPVVTGTVSVDGPFHGWHALQVCYESQGWKLEDTAVIGVPGHPAGCQMLEINMVDSAGQRARLHFCLFRQSGELLTPPLSVSAKDMAARIQGRVAEAIARQDRSTNWQLQLVTHPVSGLSVPAELQAERNLFGQVLTMLQQHWSAKRGGSGVPPDSGLNDMAAFRTNPDNAAMPTAESTL